MTRETGRSGPDRGKGGRGPGRVTVEVATLLRRPGERRRVEVDLPVEDLVTSAVTAEHIGGAVVVESMSDSLTVSGTVEATWSGECRRCLGPAVGVTEVDIHEIFERRPTEGETYPLDDDVVDLAPMLAEQVLLSLPLAPLCADDCVGPDPDRFPATVAPDDAVADGDAGTDGAADDGPVRDPRWAALDALRFDEPGSDDAGDGGAAER